MHTKIQEALKKKKLSSLVLINTSFNKQDPSIPYILGMQLEYGAVIITQKKEVVLVPAFEVERVRKESTIKTVIALKKSMFKEIRPHLERGSIGINKTSISLLEYFFLKKALKRQCIDFRKELLQLRIIKNKQEIEYIKNAAKIGDFIFQKVLKRVKRTWTECQLKTFIQTEILLAGCTESFETIVATGKNAAHPHHVSTSTKLKGFSVIDFGVKYRGYCSDMTRTLYFGKPTVKEKEMYYTVLNVQQAAQSMIKVGVHCSTLDQFVRKKLGKHFCHSLGHGIGVEIHEKPSLSSLSKETFQEGYVFTIEPGVYVKGKYGIRIEDDYVLHSGKVEALTKSKKTLIEI